MEEKLETMATLNARPSSGDSSSSSATKKKVKYTKSDRMVVDIGMFHDAAKRLHVSPGGLCRQIGYTDSAWHRWEQAGKIPKAVSLAVEALVRRAGPSANAHTAVIVTVIKDGRIVSSKHFEGIGEAKINNQVYLLVPKPSA